MTADCRRESLGQMCPDGLLDAPGRCSDVAEEVIGRDSEVANGAISMKTPPVKRRPLSGRVICNLLAGCGGHCLVRSRSMGARGSWPDYEGYNVARTAFC